MQATYSLRPSVGYAFMMDYEPYHSPVPTEQIEAAFSERKSPRAVEGVVTPVKFSKWLLELEND